MSTWYGQGLGDVVLNSSADYTAGEMRVALVSDNTAYTPDPANETYVSEVLDSGTTAEEFNDTSGNYSRQDLDTSFATRSGDTINFSLSSDPNFGVLDGDTIQGVLIYHQVGGDDSTPGDDPVYYYFDGGDFPYTPSGSEDISIDLPSPLATISVA